MPDLKHSTVYRGGITASRLSSETSKVCIHVNTQERSIEFRFNIDSKGGGVTSILLSVGFADLGYILNSAAEKSHEELIPLLSSALKKAARQLRAAAKQLRADAKCTRKVATQLTKKMERVESFVRSKYCAAPSEQDEEEREILELVEDIQVDLSEMS